jgi:hypothetical protein
MEIEKVALISKENFGLKEALETTLKRFQALDESKVNAKDVKDQETTYLKQ